MQVAESRMTASVGSMMVGSSRRSTRTSFGPWRTAPRMVGVLSLAVPRKSRLETALAHIALGPTGVGGRSASRTAVGTRLVGLPARGQGGHGDQAALSGARL